MTTTDFNLILIPMMIANQKIQLKTSILTEILKFIKMRQLQPPTTGIQYQHDRREECRRIAKFSRIASQ